jgi:hypothetical protein
MRQKRTPFFFLTLGMLLVAGGFFLVTATPARAQCGSQASSCKNCHETQAQDPVNNDGTTWHTQHAFGDFCYLCHAGNNQATDKVVSHTGMVAPLADINASCKSCHPTDTLVKAQIYATTLGQQVGTGGSAAAPTDLPASSAAPTTAPAALVPAADMVDYSQRYDAQALGKTPVNIGNIILIAILAVIVLGGGFFILKREGWVKISFEDPKRVPVTEKYPVDVIEMLPNINHLKPDSRRILQNILVKPQVASELLASIDKLTRSDPETGQESEEQEE